MIGEDFFWEEFFLGRIFWEELFGRNSLFTLFMLFHYVCQDFGFIQDLVSRQKEGRKEGQEFRSLEVQGKLIALKKNWIGKLWGGLENYFYVRPQIKHDKNWPKMGIKKIYLGPTKNTDTPLNMLFLDANFCIWWCWLWASPTSSSSTQYAEFLLNSKKLSSTPGSKNDFYKQFITQNNFQLIYMMAANGHSKVK